MIPDTSTRPALARGALLTSAAVALLLVLVSGEYGPHRDELYFEAAGAHPAWGYPDQPSFTPMVARLMALLFPDSLTALRLPAALAAGLTVLLVALTARELGGTRRAQVLAAVATGLSGAVLVPGHMLHTTTFDLTFSAALVWLLVKVVRGADPRLLLAAGGVLGVALHNKYLIGALVAALLVGILATGPRALLRSPWLWAGAGLAVLVWLPNLVWQVSNGLPQLRMAQILSEGSAGGVAFVAMQALVVGPLLVPLWVGGLVRLLRTPDLRLFGVAYLVLAAALLVAGGSPLYLFDAYPPLLAAGALVVDGWLGRSRGRAVVATAAGTLSALFILPVALPLVPVHLLDRVPVLQLNGLATEQFGWPELTSTVAGVYRNLSPAERARTTIVTENFGEAAALQRYGPAHGLPSVHSGYRGYAAWERPPATARDAILVQPAKFPDAPVWARTACTELRQVATVHNSLGIRNREHGGTVWLCQGLTRTWDELWPSITHLN
ncbi:hypothetical protein JOF53_002209 [Crossiella equi]|uniref:Glycosyltransferase RgtA/B/C/D-like domain-containing protein n=1 Tax=Crossiella equi TaxID=130796 RepID=A0ABS5AAM3_9PSEU|nr:glycosyltransferase family 39 protein [Crossiella equi]MBP2473337.1 hypothetical protein [Crossiella equi]